MQRRFQQLDVFTDELGYGNPVAVVIDGDGLTDDQMARFARWTNLSETTFVLPPTDDQADYRVRIFTPTEELPFAGHPTLGTCQAWLNAGGTPRSGTHADTVVQECGLGNIAVRVSGDRLSFAAPRLIRSGPLSDEIVATIVGALGVEPRSIEWADNGPRWVAVELDDADAVLGVAPTTGTSTGEGTGEGDAGWLIGVYGNRAETTPKGGHGPGIRGPDIEVRAFFPVDGTAREDPVTGSLNAGIAQILFGRSADMTSYVAHQGTALGRNGRVHLERDGETIWVGGSVVSAITGQLDW